MKNTLAKIGVGLCICLLAGGCARKGEDYAELTDIVDSFPIQAEPAGKNPQQAPDSQLHAVFHTSAGEITVMLYPEQSPREVQRFVEQAKAGLYDNQQFIYVRRGGLIECDNVNEQPEESTDGDTQASENASQAETQAPESKDAAEPELSSSQPADGPQAMDGPPADTEQEDALESEKPVQPVVYSDELHHYYGSVGISAKNEQGGDRLHFVVEQTTPEDERLVPANLYMNELINQRTFELNARTAEAPLTDEELETFEKELNQEIAKIGTEGVPEEYQKKYEAAARTYNDVGGQWALDYKYPVIGQVVEGLNVADAISQAKISPGDRRPKQEIVIYGVEILEG